MLETGDHAPDFTLENDTGETISLSGLRGKPVVLYFYPKDDTSGCTTEALEFTALMPAFTERGAAVFGISPDSAKTHCKFRDKHALAVPLLADPERKAIGAYGVWVEKSMYGRISMGVERATYLIGKDGSIARIWRKVKAPGHAAEVLAAVKAA